MTVNKVLIYAMLAGARLVHAQALGPRCLATVRPGYERRDQVGAYRVDEQPPVFAG